MDDARNTIAALAGVVAFFCMIGVVLWFVVKGARKLDEPRQRLARAMPVESRYAYTGHGFPIDPSLPGRFKIVGVDKTSRMDTTWHTLADSEANARVKAELEGIVVTKIERD